MIAGIPNKAVTTTATAADKSTSWRILALKSNREAAPETHGGSRQPTQPLTIGNCKIQNVCVTQVKFGCALVVS